MELNNNWLSSIFFFLYLFLENTVYVLKRIDITNCINVKHSWQEFSHFQFEIRDYVNTESSKFIDCKVTQ